MKEPFEKLANLDRTVHEPARLAILTALHACRSADFVYLQSLTGLSKGNLSSHLSRLEEAGLVTIEKGYSGKTPNTLLKLTRDGRVQINAYWNEVKAIRNASLRWSPAR
jgi:DNA-binding transcriptional ArsR family regulator